MKINLLDDHASYSKKLHEKFEGFKRGKYVFLKVDLKYFL